MNQHVLLQVKTNVLLLWGDSSSHGKLENFDSNSIPLQWVLRIDELLFDSTSSSGSSEDSIRLDEQILEVKWNSTKTEDGWAGIAACSLLLPLETSTRRSNRALLLAIWERDLETGSRRFLSQQLTHVPKTTPVAGTASDKDYSWNPNTVVEMNIKVQHTGRNVRFSRSLEANSTSSFGFWAFVAVSVAGLFHLWKGPRPTLVARSSTEESADHDVESEMVEAENDIDETNEEASCSNYEDDECSQSSAFVLLRSRSSDESDEDEREQQDMSLERPPSMERRMINTVLDKGISFVDALDEAIENFILEQSCRLKKRLSVGNKAVGPLGNDAVSSYSPEAAAALDSTNGESACSTATVDVGQRMSRQESPGLLKFGDEFASLGFHFSAGSPIKIVESQENTDTEATKVIIQKENVFDEIQTRTEPKREESQPDPTVELQQIPEKFALLTKQSKKRPRHLMSSEENEGSDSNSMRDRECGGSQTECKNTWDRSPSKHVPDIGCKQSNGALRNENSATPQPDATDDVEQAGQKDTERDDDRDVVTSSSFAPDWPLQDEQVDCLETSRNEFLSKDSEYPDGSLGLGEQDDSVMSPDPTGEKEHLSQLADDERSDTQVDEISPTVDAESLHAVKSTAICFPVLDAEPAQVDEVSIALSLETSAPPDSLYNSTLPPEVGQKDTEQDADGGGMATSSFAPDGLDCIETARNVALDNDSDGPKGSLDAAIAHVAAVGKPCTSQSAVGESSNIELDEMDSCCPDKSSTVETNALCSPTLDAESIQADPVASSLSFEAPPAPPDSPYTSTLPPDSSSSYSDSSVDTLCNGSLEYTKTMLEKSAELRSVAGDDILAEFVPSAALKTAARAMKDFSFEFEGKGSKAVPLVLKELCDTKSKRSTRARSFSDSLETSKSKEIGVLQNCSQRTVSYMLSPNLPVQRAGVLGEDTPALKTMVSPSITTKAVKRNAKATDPNSLSKDSSRKRRIFFNGKEKLTEPCKKTKKLESHPADPFDYNDDSERVDPFA